MDIATGPIRFFIRWLNAAAVKFGRPQVDEQKGNGHWVSDDIVLTPSSREGAGTGHAVR